jgi:protein-S-isoprenylcysteine O-methyltransferase Ste14
MDYRILLPLLLGAYWFAWLYPFLFRAPHNQTRESIAVIGPTRVGLLLESFAIFLAMVWHLPAPPGETRIALAVVFGAIGLVLAWTSVRHLGRQFRVHAGLYVDHRLVKTGPYGVVRHPIYAGLLAALLCCQMLLTPWPWIAVSLAIYFIGTEIRVRTEDRLLASRFGDEFEAYRRAIPAYIPFVR